MLWSWFLLCIAAHPIHTGTPFLAFVVAVSTILLVGHWVHTLTFTTYLWVLTFLPTIPTIKSVCRNIHAIFLVATIGPGAALGTANPRVLVTCHHHPGALSKEAACPSERSWFLGFKERNIKVFHCRFILIIEKWVFFRWCCPSSSNG